MEWKKNGTDIVAVIADLCIANECNQFCFFLLLFDIWFNDETIDLNYLIALTMDKPIWTHNTAWSGRSIAPLIQ